MAVLKITEFSGTFGGQPLAMLSTGIIGQTLTIGTTSAVSAAFDSATHYVRLLADTACYVNVVRSTATVATSTSPLPVAANITEYFAVPPGGSYRIAAITT